MMKRLKHICSALVLAFGLVISAQEAIVVSGGDATGSGGTVAYSIGQVLYNTNSGSSISIAEGLQQPFEISTILSVEDIVGLKLDLMAFPNPANRFLTLKLNAPAAFDVTTLRYQLFDIRGSLILNERIREAETTISLDRLANAVYVLKVVDNSKEIKTFKIIKNQ
tara:strand:- start:21739 stop:22236 length:498 start_codon:yes stop_codon:yes gene_type:complete